MPTAMQDQLRQLREAATDHGGIDVTTGRDTIETV